MARLPEQTEREEIPEEKRHIFDDIESSRGRVEAPFSLLLNSPDVAGLSAQLGAYIRFDSTLPPATRELAILSAAREFDCNFEWAHHAPLAIEAGVRQEAIDVVANDHPLDTLTAHETIIVRYCRELFREHHVSEEAYRTARARLGDRGLIELTATMGYFAMMACTINALEVDPPPGMPVLP